MSYQDTVEHYRLVDEADALERKQRLAIRQLDIAKIQKLGYRVQTFNNGLHVKISFLELWPSTGLWRNPIKKRRGKLQDGDSLIELVRREVGEPKKTAINAGGVN